MKRYKSLYVCVIVLGITAMTLRARHSQIQAMQHAPIHYKLTPLRHRRDEYWFNEPLPPQAKVYYVLIAWKPHVLEDAEIAYCEKQHQAIIQTGLDNKAACVHLQAASVTEAVQGYIQAEMRATR